MCFSVLFWFVGPFASILTWEKWASAVFQPFLHIHQVTFPERNGSWVATKLSLGPVLTIMSNVKKDPLIKSRHVQYMVISLCSLNSHFFRSLSWPPTPVRVPVGALRTALLLTTSLRCYWVTCLHACLCKCSKGKHKALKSNNTSLWYCVKGKEKKYHVCLVRCEMLVLVLRTWHRRMGWVSAGFTDELCGRGRGRPRVGKEGGKDSRWHLKQD